jgi:hypothetical protein
MIGLRTANRKMKRDPMIIKKHIWVYLILALLLAGCMQNPPEASPQPRLPTLTPFSPEPDILVHLPFLVRSEIEKPPEPSNDPEASATHTPAIAENPVVAPSITPSPNICVPPNGRDHWVSYTVQDGDTLSSLSRRTGTSVTEIQLANCLDGPLILRGQLLYLASNPIAVIDDTPNPPAEPIATTPTGEEVTPPTATTPVEEPAPPVPWNPRLSIVPSSGPAGQVFTITLEGFHPNEDVNVAFRFGTKDTAPFLILPIKVDQNGEGTLIYRSQSDDSAGGYIVTAIGDGGSDAEEYFLIEEPSITLSPSVEVSIDTLTPPSPSMLTTTLEPTSTFSPTETTSP